jgi:glycosidase
MLVPDWVQDAIFYQIFPDRFANGNSSNDPANVQPWGDPPNRWDYQGGDLRGIIQNFDYLLDLGVNALYLNPIFHSSANHRYHTIDYFQVDPFLGELRDFQELIDLAHRNGVRIILDAVLNHCGRGFFAFNNLLENGEHSPYKDWFHIKSFPLQAYRRGKASNYKGWWDIKDLPKFNTDNPEVREYLFGMTRFWLEHGIDGWRLDVPNEIDDDVFWGEYRALVKSINPHAYIVGEIWEVNPRWLDDEHFDGLMNYPLRDAIIDPLCNKAPFSLLLEKQNELQASYPQENILAMFNALSSHDTKRVMTKLRGNLAKTKLAYAALFAFPGAPAIYYGDEIGLRGGLEPASRGAFPWDDSTWNHDLRDWIKQLIQLRKESEPMRRGAFEPIPMQEQKDVLLFKRTFQEQAMLVALNYSNEKRQVKLTLNELGHSPGVILRNVLDGEDFLLAESGLEISLPVFGAAWLKPQ